MSATLWDDTPGWDVEVEDGLVVLRCQGEALTCEVRQNEADEWGWSIVSPARSRSGRGNDPNVIGGDEIASGSGHINAHDAALAGWTELERIEDADQYTYADALLDQAGL